MNKGKKRSSYTILKDTVSNGGLGEWIYQVTSNTVSNDELGNYIDILAKSVTFDTETKLPLSKEDLNNIDWYGDSAGLGREQWFYTDVCEIYGTDKTEAVTVRINNRFAAPASYAILKGRRKEAAIWRQSL